MRASQKSLRSILFTLQACQSNHLLQILLPRTTTSASGNGSKVDFTFFPLVDLIHILCESRLKKSIYFCFLYDIQLSKLSLGFQFWGSQIWRQILNFRGNCGWGGNSRIIVAFIQLLPPRTTRWEPATFLMVDVATCTFCAEHGRRERQDQCRTIVYCSKHICAARKNKNCAIYTVAEGRKLIRTQRLVLPGRVFMCRPRLPSKPILFLSYPEQD